jgi:hypothetical protein
MRRRHDFQFGANVRKPCRNRFEFCASSPKIRRSKFKTVPDLGGRRNVHAYCKPIKVLSDIGSIMRPLFAIFSLLLCLIAAHADELPVIKDSDALHYVGKNVEVRGLVVSVTTSPLGTAGISFGREYPDQTFAGFIESGKFRGVKPLSWLAIEGGNPDTSAGSCSPTARRAPGFRICRRRCAPRWLHPSVVSSPSACSRLD